MAYAILTGFSPTRVVVRPVRPAILVPFEGTMAEQRGSLVGRTFYEFVVDYILTPANAATLGAFFQARGQQRDAFLWKPVRSRHYARTGIAVTPVSDGVTVTFALPTTGEYAGDYPVNDATTLKLYRAGVLNAGAFSANVDNRTITTATVPAAGGAAMTADYHRYALVRLDGVYEEEEAFVEMNSVRSLTFREVTS